jgi:hypothetical protein
VQWVAIVNCTECLSLPSLDWYSCFLFVVWCTRGPETVFRTQLGLLPNHLPSHKTGVLTVGCDQTGNPACCRD